MTKPITLIFKTVEDLNISMDVYLPEGAPKSKDGLYPVLLWWHGGGLIQGSKINIPPHMLSAPEKYKLCLVSPDYRLAPQIRMPGILDDCKSAIDFLHTDAFAKATNNCVNPSNIVLSGSSAGGWFSLLAGTGIGFEACGLALPRPVRGIVPIYPITDLVHPFWKTKQHPVSYMDRVIEHSEVQSFIDPLAPPEVSAGWETKRSIFYSYMVQESILSSLLLDGTGIPENAFSVASALISRKTLAPPTYIITGNKDDKVPHEQSLAVVSALKSIESVVHYEELDGLNHGFDIDELYTLDNVYKFVEDVFYS